MIIKYLENPITINDIMAASVNLTFPSPLLFLPGIHLLPLTVRGQVTPGPGTEQANGTSELWVGGGDAISRNDKKLVVYVSSIFPTWVCGRTTAQ